MSNIIFSEIILTAVSLSLLLIFVLYEDYQVKKLIKQINYSKNNGKNYKAIFDNILNKK